MARRGIVARVHIAPMGGTRESAIGLVAVWLFTQNALWLSAQLRAGKTPPRRLLLAAPPWCTSRGGCDRGVRYVTHHGDEPRARERDYFDGPTAMHVGEATCIDIAAYDAAAMYVLEQRDAATINVRAWPDMHFVVEVGESRFDTSTINGALASLKETTTPWPRPYL